MTQDLSNKYFVSTDGTSWEDVTTKWNGVKVLSITDMNAKGEAVNVYSEQWINSQTEDFMVTTKDSQQNDVIIRKNVDINLTFIVSRRYAGTRINEQLLYDEIVSYMCDRGSFYIKSAYTNKYAKVACLKSFKPTTEKLNRGERSYILATIPLHVLDTIQVIVPTLPYVDLGLPSGNLWATKNLSASSPTDGGLFYCLGELNGYEDAAARNDVSGLDEGFSMDAYIELNERNLNVGTLPLSKDAAHITLGENWYIPSKADLQELVDNCTLAYEVINDTPCCVFTASNGNSLVFPYVGIAYGNEIQGDGDGTYIFASTIPDGYGDEGNGWYADDLVIVTSEGQTMAITGEPCPIFFGCSIRPVYKTM